MTDFGTTGIQVAPKAPTEDEMNNASDILKRMISAVVGMSQLQADVDTLRQTVDSLQSDANKLRNQNAGLDEALFQSRQARQDLAHRLDEAQREAEEAKTNAARLQASNVDLAQHNEALGDQLHLAEQSRDDAELKAMDLEDKLKATEAKLAAIKEGYKSIFGEEPKAMQPEPSPPTPAPVPEPVHSEPVTLGQTFDPTPAQPTKVYHGSEWAPGRMWDSQRGEYYDET